MGIITAQDGKNATSINMQVTQSVVRIGFIEIGFKFGVKMPHQLPITYHQTGYFIPYFDNVSVNATLAKTFVVYGTRK
jgi:hypothetical protein